MTDSTNKPPDSTPQTPVNKSRFVQKGFSEIAPVYDRFNNLITFGLHKVWKNKVAVAILKNNPQYILDACCGTGDIAQITAHLAINKKTSPKITGFDFSAAMLKIADKHNGYPNIVSYVEGDITNSGFPDSYFNAISIGFGLRNVGNIPECLRELNRITAPGGVLVILDMGKIQVPIIRWLYHFYFFGIVPLIGRALHKTSGMFTYFPKSVDDYPSAKSLKLLLEQNGFGKTGVQKLALGSITIHTAYKTEVIN